MANPIKAMHSRRYRNFRFAGAGEAVPVGDKLRFDTNCSFLACSCAYFSKMIPQDRHSCVSGWLWPHLGHCIMAFLLLGSRILAMPDRIKWSTDNNCQSGA